MLVDTTALFQLYKQLDRKTAGKYADMSAENQKVIWDDVFHLWRAKGVQFPGLKER